MLAKVGNAKKLPLVDLPKDTIVLVDIMAFFFDIIKAIAQKRTMVDICSMLLRRFDDHPAVEFYLDGHGNQQNSPLRWNAATSPPCCVKPRSSLG